MKAWAGVAGTGEVAMRIPSAGFSVLSVLVTYLLMRRIAPEPVSLLSALLVSLSPFQVMAGQEARMHALLGTLALGSTLALVGSVERGGTIRWSLYVALAAAIAYTQYLGFFILIAHGLWVAICERRRLGAWLISMGTVAVLYVPWMPSLWHHANGVPFWPNNVRYRNPLDLLGLFAFGGSLFGMGSYFFPGTLDPALQLLILSPFLVVLGIGIASFAADRRAMALLGLPPAVAIGVILTASFSKAIFYPRWFSFLAPFYAMFLARGIVAIAARARGAQNHVLAGLTAALILCNVPVLDRYYFDPGFRPFRWRAAAVDVGRLAQPGDFFLYSNQAAEISFTYYFRDAHPSLTLTPMEWVRAGDPRATFTTDRVRRLAAQHPRVWFIVTIPFTPVMQRRIVPVLDSAYTVVGAGDFNQARVYLLEARPPAH